MTGIDLHGIAASSGLARGAACIFEEKEAGLLRYTGTTPEQKYDKCVGWLNDVPRKVNQVIAKRVLLTE
jgi:hypothetical protein